MNDLERATDLIRRRVRVDWDESYLELGAIRLGARRTRRRRTIALTSTVAACAVAFAAARSHAPRPVERNAAPVVALSASPATGPEGEAAARVLRFSDGSTATPSDDATAVSIADDTPSRMVAVLAAGRSRFDVVPRPSRMFAVQAGPVTVFVIGTAFVVDRRDDHVDVSVEHGRVRVESPFADRELGPGEHATFSLPSTVDASAARPVAAAGAPAPPTWRTLARQRRFQEAYRLLPEATQTIETPQDLLLAADSARLSGHPEAAVKYLARIVNRFPRDFSAQLAAFSLGTIYLDQLDRPGDAAFRFGQARALAGRGALAEDALVRELEALARAGDADEARARAEEYVRLFPNGRHLELARKLGRLD